MFRNVLKPVWNTVDPLDILGSFSERLEIELGLKLWQPKIEIFFWGANNSDFGRSIFDTVLARSTDKRTDVWS